MNVKRRARLFLLISILFLASCTHSKPELTVGEAISFIEKSSRQAAALENGKYTFVMIKEAPSERKEETTEGIFQNINGAYHWHTKWALDSLTQTWRALKELGQQDGSQYSRMGLINERNEFISDDGTPLPAAPAWQKLAENRNDPPPHLSLLTEIELDEADIATVEVQEEEGNTTCIFTYNEGYLAAQDEANLSAVEQQLEQAITHKAEPPRIHSLEKTVDYQKKLELIESVLSLTVDPAGVLTGYRLDSSFEYRIKDMAFSLSQRKQLILQEYNLPDLTVELPNGLM